jgi:hypothetical protein
MQNIRKLKNKTVIKLKMMINQSFLHLFFENILIINVIICVNSNIGITRV